LHLHLNLAGGLTGDMFIAAVLDAFPRFEAQVMAAIDALDAPYPVVCSLVAHSDYEMTGRRFEVEPFDKYFGYIPFAFPVLSHGDCISHELATWDSVRERLNTALIEPSVLAHAIKIFELLVAAESDVHGIEPGRVAFQQVSAWDAIAEIVGAAALIDGLGAARWTASPLPLGEVVTPAGIAIVAYLCPPSSGDRTLPRVRTLAGSGTGFGSRRLSASSHMRVLWFDEDAMIGHRDLTRTVSFAADRLGQQPAQ
jgi:pyridinium-3,5-bisthiocarboxylic acid mononucleotide nickel chelatase